MKKRKQIDQAAGLRALMQPALPRLVVSVAAHEAALRHDGFMQLARAGAQLGHELLLLDGSRGELAQLLKLRIRYELIHLLEGEKRFDEVAQELPHQEGLRYLPAQRGLRALAEVQGGMRNLLQGFAQLQRAPDFVVAHGGPDLIPTLVELAVVEGNMIWRVTPRPEVITATYAQLKIVARKYPTLRHRVWLHGVLDSEDADHAFANLAEAAQRFLGVELQYLGFTGQSSGPVEDATLQPDARVHCLANILFQGAADRWHAAEEIPETQHV